MATVTVFTAARMKIIEDSTVVDGYVDSGHHLILEKRDGTLIDAGDISAISTMSVEDGQAIDLTLTGSGTPASPWKLKAEIIGLTGPLMNAGTVKIELLPDPTQLALLDGSYRGEGTAKVNTGNPGGALSTLAYPWMTPYVPNAGREVRLMRTGNSFAIAGQTMGERVNLTLATNWYVYDEITVSTGFSPKAQAHKLKTGLVVLKGLLRYNGTPAAGSLITTLPVGMRPDSSILLPALFNDQVGTIRINPDGQVLAYTTPPASSYISLDGLTFFAAGSVTWTNVGSGGSAFGSNFKEPTDTSVWGKVKWYKDPYGFVWFQGVVEITSATSTDNTPIITMPTSCASYLEQHFRGSTTQYVGLGYNDTSGTPRLNWKTNDPGAVGNTFSISGVSAITMDAFNNNPWYTPFVLANSWVPNSSTHPVPRFLRREDGLCMTMGLVRAGTMGTRLIQTHPELWPRLGRIILATISNNGNARIDVGSDNDTDQNMKYGWIMLQQGSNTWFGIDGLKWVP